MKITELFYSEAFEIAKKIFNNEIKFDSGVNELMEKFNSKLSTTTFYLSCYKAMKNGNAYERTINANATKYYIEKIYKENGLEAFKKAVIALDGHINYYENINKSKNYKCVSLRRLSIDFHSKIESIEPIEPIEPIESTQKTINITTQYVRDTEVVKQVKERALGKCEYCKNIGFKMVNGESYTEAHHVIPLSCKGVDKVWNVIALCPEDHKKAHFGIDRLQLRDSFIDFLVKKYPLASELLNSQKIEMDKITNLSDILESDEY